MSERAFEKESLKSLDEQVQDATNVAEAECRVPSVLPAYKLMVFNELYSPDAFKHTPDVLERRLKQLKEIELTYQKKFPLIPTIGVELEVPKNWISISQRDVIDGFYIHCTPENDSVTEISPFFSFSSHTQSRILEECVKLGINPEKQPEKDLERTSVHINLGIPEEMRDDTEHFIHETRSLTDAMTYGFVPPERIKWRKTRESRQVKSAFGPHSSLRLELRTPDFSSSTTFRMLEEVQLLAAACFAYIKDQDEVEVSEDELKLSSVWATFRLEVQTLLEDNKLDVEKGAKPLYDTNPDTLFRLLSSKPQITKSFRSLITRTSKEIKKIVQLDL